LTIGSARASGSLPSAEATVDSDEAFQGCHEFRQLFQLNLFRSGAAALEESLLWREVLDFDLVTGLLGAALEACTLGA